MRVNAGIIIFIGLVVLVGTVEAVGMPDTITVKSDKQWIVANNFDQSTITITVTNTTIPNQGPVSGIPVILAVNNSVYGTLSATALTTDASGNATTTFKVNTKSGAAQITATINSPSLSGSVIQNIDHDTPYTVTFDHPFNGTVATVVPFTLSLTDQNKNPIENRKEVALGSPVHTVGLHVHGPAPDNCNFVENGLHDISRAIDNNGNLTLNIKLTSKIGYNYISMDSVGSITNKMESIEAVGTGIPYSMTSTISPLGVLPANGIDKFVISYFLYDAYGNPLNNKSVSIHTNLTDETDPKIYRSNSLGQVQMTYGPKISVLTAKISATPIDNSSLSSELIAQFVSSGIGSNLILVITPEIMASRETDPTKTIQQARVVGSLTDAWGNPVPGKDVIFTISNIQTAPYNKTADPMFENGLLSQTKTTDSNGNAIITFYPGSFVSGGPDYSDAATGSCDVIATDGTLTTNTVHLEWKNFAYLSVAVNVTPQMVHVNDTVDVNIKIRGDGYKMVQNPITVVLDMDATSNLAATSDGTNLKTRWENAQNASVTFINNMSSQDQVGLVTHGFWENIKYWQLVSNITYNRPNVITAITNLTPSGGLGGNATTLKDSVLAAVSKIVTNPLRNPNEIPAIVTIGANSYAKNSNDLNDMVKATWTDNNIRIYSILYLSTANGCDKNNDGTYKNSEAQNLYALNTATHGKFYCALSRPQVDQFFVDIYQNLSTIAGVDTSMDLDFDNVSYVTNGTTMFGNDTVSYVPVNAGLPGQYINYTKNNIDSMGRTSIIWTDGNQSVINQSEDWNDDFHLNFTIGTIRTQETWETTFRLRMNKEGVIDLFGPGSTITYNGGSGSLKLPATYIISVNETIPKGVISGTLDVSNLAVTKSGVINDYIPMKWNLHYQGSATATETMYYSPNNGATWVQFARVTGIAPNESHTYTHFAQLDVRKFQPGNYLIKVHGFAPDSPDDQEITAAITINSTGKFIKLE